jgi:L-aminopeptidase/D-esterase-like protein
VVVNALGDVVDPSTGQIIAGTREPLCDRFADTTAAMCSLVGRNAPAMAGNTVIGAVATNAQLDKAGVTKVAQMAHDGLARAIRPAHTMFDGDAIFALATGEQKAEITLVGALAADALAEAIVRGVRAAQGAGGVPAAGELR